MEDIKKLLENNGSYLMSSSDENDSEIESPIWLSNNQNEVVSFTNDASEMKCTNSITSKKRNGENKLPTRRPDPNVYNRNALLARENRRKKKIYLETIEKQLQVAREANRVLAKALKRQLKKAQRLEQEKKYFENLVTNRSEILKLVNAQIFHHSSKSGQSPFSVTSNNGDSINNDSRDEIITTSHCSNLYDAGPLSIDFDTPSDGSVNTSVESFVDFSYDFSAFPDFFTDMDNGSNTSLPTTSTTWDDIWGENDYYINNLILPKSVILQSDKCMQSVSDDHSYVATSSVRNFQIPEQKSKCSDYIDVEGDGLTTDVFCSSNNWTTSCRTPPLQLLSEQSTF